MTPPLLWRSIALTGEVTRSGVLLGVRGRTVFRSRSAAHVNAVAQHRCRSVSPCAGSATFLSMPPLRTRSPRTTASLHPYAYAYPVFRATVAAGLAALVILLTGGVAVADFTGCPMVEAALGGCLGSQGGAEMPGCQSEVDALAVATSGDPSQRMLVCVCIQHLEDGELHNYPNRDIAALNHRLRQDGLYARNCDMPGRPDPVWEIPEQPIGMTW